MDHLVTLIGIAGVVFVSTNIDDVFVLIGFLADPKVALRQVVLGQYIGIAALFGASAAASSISLVIPPVYVGLLGLAPIAIGVKKAWDLRGSADEGVAHAGDGSPSPAGHGNVFAVAAVTIANGGDNISIYTPLFATRSAGDIALIGAVFAVMTLLWIGGAYWLTHHPTIGAPIRRHGQRLVPVVLIGLGLLILYESGTLGWLRAEGDDARERGSPAGARELAPSRTAEGRGAGRATG